jgi:hypothetical protein
MLHANDANQNNNYQQLTRAYKAAISAVSCVPYLCNISASSSCATHVASIDSYLYHLLHVVT